MAKAIRSPGSALLAQWHGLGNMATDMIKSTVITNYQHLAIVWMGAKQLAPA